MLRDYQREMIERARDACRHGARRPCLVLGCGGGKSIIAAEIARSATDKGGRVLFLVHRRELCTQIYSTFRAHGVDMKLCKVMMVQTACRRLDKLPAPQLILIDEAHHTLARSYLKTLEAFPNARCIGVTATPARLNGDGLGRVFDALVEGPSTAWMIEHQYLAPYDYYAPSVADLNGLHTRRGDYIPAEVEARMIKRAVFGDVIAHYRHLADGRQAICYCASVNHSLRMAESFSAAGIPARHLDGKTPAAMRAREIERFRTGETRILCNVDLISEGFDVPDCGASILLRPTQSLTLYIQQAMRCMRYLPGKRATIIDHVGNYARFGLPDMDRDWTLEDAPRARRRRSEPPSRPEVRQCPECLYCHYTAPVCPRCGYEYLAKERALEEIMEAHLDKVVGFALDFRGPEDCHTYEELRAYGKSRGYKPGWAWHQAKQRGFIRA